MLAWLLFESCVPSYIGPYPSSQQERTCAPAGFLFRVWRIVGPVPVAKTLWLSRCVPIWKLSLVPHSLSPLLQARLAQFVAASFQCWSAWILHQSLWEFVSHSVLKVPPSRRWKPSQIESFDYSTLNNWGPSSCFYNCSPMRHFFCFSRPTLWSLSGLSVAPLGL